MKRTSMLLVFALLVCLIVAMSAWPAIAAGAPSSTPDKRGWITNEAVGSTAIGPDGTVYISGSFTYVGPNTGSGAALDATTGAPDMAMPYVNRAVIAVVSDGAGGFYIAGGFTKVGSVSRNRIAHILPNGTVDPDFDPDASESDGDVGCVVRSLALSGSTLYVGGDFTTIGGQARHNLAALNVNTGLARAWNPNVNSTVRALAVSGSTVYAGGAFTSVNGTTSRTRLAAFDATTSVATAWSPSADGVVYALAVSGSTVWVGGSFGSGSDPPGSCLVALDATTGVATPWSPNGVGAVFALAVSGPTIYVGGEFFSIGGQLRTNLAALDAATGVPTLWDPGVGGGWSSADVYALAASGSTVYAGGYFGFAGGQPRSCIAALDATTGVATSWDPHAERDVYALAVSGSTVYAGGKFPSIGGKTRNYLAAFDPITGAATAWDPNANGGAGRLVVSGSTVYVAGGFTTIGGQSRHHLAALDATTGAATSWDPGVSGGIYAASDGGYVDALAVSGSTVYAGGDFDVIGGADRNCIAAIDATTGLATSWDPNVTSDVTAYYESYVRALAVSGSTVYVGGRFTTVNGTTPRVSMAAFDATTGTATSWEPDPFWNEGEPGYWMGGTISALTVSGSAVYAGGSFTSIGGKSRNYLAALDATTGAATSWNPLSSAPGNGAAVHCIVVAGPNVYIAGSFGVPFTFSGQVRTYTVVLNASTGAPTAWDPDIGHVLDFAIKGSTLYAVGDFDSIAGKPRPGFARFSGPPPVTEASGAGWQNTPTTVTLTTTSNGSGMTGGVARTEYRLDDAIDWTTGSSVFVDAPADHSNDGPHQVRYRSIDAAGNIEATNLATVRIDTEAPTTLGAATSGRKGIAIALRYKITDSLSPRATAIRIVVRSSAGTAVKIIRPADKATGSWYRVPWTPTATGTYHYFVYAKDLAGNAQATVGSAKVVVR